jgi:hypothetical protein
MPKLYRLKYRGLVALITLALIVAGAVAVQIDA